MTNSSDAIEVLGDLVAHGQAETDGNAVALRSDGGTESRYSYAEFGRTARQTGNYLAHHHIGPDRPVGVAADPHSPALLTLFGAALLGGAVYFEPPTPTDLPCLLAPTERLQEWQVGPGTARIAYGETPADPGVVQFEQVVTRENPGFPPTAVEPETEVLRTPHGPLTHSTLLTAARACRERADITAGTEVVLRTDLADAGAIVGGIVLPLLARATVVLPGESTVGDIAVSTDPAPELTILDPATVRPVAGE